MASVFGSCGDKFVTFVKGFDENGCPIVTFTEADPKPGCDAQTCEVLLGPFLKGVTVNDNPLGITEDLIAELTINYVPYDEALHVEGSLLGTGTAEDPLQVPVKPINFEFVKYDPALHVEGQALQGAGTSEDPWLIPVKECNFEYVSFDAEVHSEGEIQGDGTPGAPWQIPLQEINLTYATYDPSIHAEGSPVAGEGTEAAPWQVPVKPCNFQFVDFDPDVHVEGQAIGGAGTVADPWLIPVDQKNFELVTYDPAIHVAGQPLQGTGDVATPWLVPVKECNFEYVAYDPAVHDLGGVEGDGTPANPWQVPLFTLDTDLKICAVRIVNNPVNGENVYSFEYDVCDITGTVVDTLTAANVPVPTFVNKQGIPQTGQIDIMQLADFPAPSGSSETATALMGLDANGECATYTPRSINFEYVPFDEAVHTQGVIQGDGTSGSPWQVPFTTPKECNFVYVPFDEATHGQGLIEGDGTAANPWQIPTPPEVVIPDAASFAYAPFDPATHTDGNLAGAGTTADPFQIPLEPAKECNFTYVDFDEAIHGETDSGNSAIVGDGTAANPWQIPRPCCDDAVVEPPCELETVCQLPAETVAAPGAGGAPVNFGLNITASERGNEGYAVLIPGSGGNASAGGQQSVIPNFASAAGLDIPVPAATAGCVLSLQLAWGAEGNANRGVNQLGDLVYSVNGADVANDLQIHYNNTSDSGMHGSVILLDAVTGAAGSFVNVSVPNALLVQNQTELKGVVNWQWHEICADDGQPINTSDYLAGSDVAHGFGGTPSAENPHNSGDFVADENCDGIAYTFGRHVQNPQAGTTEEILDSDWNQWQGGASELTDTVSWDTTGNPCEAGMSAASIDAGSTWSVDILGNRTEADPAWIDQAWLHAGTFACERASAGGEPGESAVKTVDWIAPCDGRISCVVSGQMQAVVEQGESVLITPYFNGVAYNGQAVVATATGGVPVNFVSALTDVVDGDTGACNFYYTAETTTGTGAANTVSVGNIEMTVAI